MIGRLRSALAGPGLSYVSLALIVLALAFLYGRYSRIHNWFPEALLQSAGDGMRMVKDRLKGKPPEYLVTAPRNEARVIKTAQAAGGLNLVSTVTAKGVLYIALVDADGRELHRWNVDWFRVWPDATHAPKDLKPRERPGTEVMGMLLDANGDLTYVYDHLGMVKMDVCGAVKWRLPVLAHHTVTRDEAGNYWAPSLIVHERPMEGLANYYPPFREFTLVQVSPDGKVLRQISVTRLLQQNGLQGLLYLATHNDFSTRMEGGDTLHMNDVDIFPSTMKPGVAQPGDIMISLRNVNAVLILDGKTLATKRVVQNRFVRQHDPDFVDGDHITIYDNNNVSDARRGSRSRLIEVDLRNDKVTTLFEGDAAHPFYSQYRGSQQQLANGGHLLVEAAEGRLVEVGPGGAIAWEYRNTVSPGLRAQIFNAQRIAPEVMTADRIASLSARCRPGA